MKFKTKYFLPLAFFTCTFMFSCRPCQRSPYKAKPKASKPIRKNDIKVQHDTIYIDTTNVNKRFAGGMFVPSKSIIVAYHFIPNQEHPRVKEFCQRNANQFDFIYAHELDHARKAIMTKQTTNRTPYARAQLAAINEIAAPAAEIIFAVEYRRIHGVPHPGARGIIAEATDAIVGKYSGDSTRYYSCAWGGADFNKSSTADQVLYYATKKFLSGLRRGYYRSTIDRAPTTPIQLYKPSGVCDIVGVTTFMPEIGMWAPMWQYRTNIGMTNIWDAASPAARERLLQVVDSVVAPAFAGKTPIFIPKTR